MKMRWARSPGDLRGGLCESIQKSFLSRILWVASCTAAVAAAFAPYCSAMDAGPSRCWKAGSKLSTASTPSVCSDPSENSQVKQALRLVCLQGPVEEHLAAGQRPIVVGFLGGFAKRGDLNHPEVWFARYLREHYTSAIYAEVLSNHDAEAALRDVFGVLDTDCDGTLSESEKRNARIILYGHSWGASETVAFARKLGRLGIPVRLTVQIDIVPKPGENCILIPSNVEQAVNFFQSAGFLRGQSRIAATDPARTKIIGNFRMTYRNHSVDCRNFPWFVRTFNKPHHEIENDSRVWQQIISLIDTDLRPETGIIKGDLSDTN
jgi:pimeloyl-ACP methyl ester carboxylesterase